MVDGRQAGLGEVVDVGTSTGRHALQLAQDSGVRHAVDNCSARLPRRRPAQPLAWAAATLRAAAAPQAAAGEHTHLAAFDQIGNHGAGGVRTSVVHHQGAQSLEDR